MNLEEEYLQSVIKQCEYYKMLGDKSINQLDEHQLYWTPNEESNSIIQIVKHLVGNMLSRWTDFRTTDGEKEWRQRDHEFENELMTKEKLLTLWNEGWNCFLPALKGIQANELQAVIYIRNQGHSIIEAVNRQLAHYPYHVGQIVYIAKVLKGKQWQCLSIPRGASQNYNQEKFSQEKERKHFTDEILKK